MKLIRDMGMIEYGRQGRKARYGMYACACGNETRVVQGEVKRGKITRCDKCADIDRAKCRTTHGKSYTKIYRVWRAELSRCNLETDGEYHNYGGRGISVSDEFCDFEIWLEHIESLIDAYKPTYSIDRIDNDGNYERGNIRWASKSEQVRNTRRWIKYDGEHKLYST